MIRKVTGDKKECLNLSLLADEQKGMVDRYLNKNVMCVLDDNEVDAECVVTDEGSSVLEIKSIAVVEKFQRKGYGRDLIEFIEDTYCEHYRILRVGIGGSSLTIPFYQKCRFAEISKIRNFYGKLQPSNHRMWKATGRYDYS
jgi:hypothetical protein